MGKFFRLGRREVIGMGVREGTYGTYAYVPDVGVRMVSEYTVFCPKEEKN